MKKLLVILAFSLGLFVYFYFTPYFLRTEKIQDNLIVQVNESLGMDIAVKEVSVHWFPYPHLFIAEVQAQNSIFSADIPEIRAVPDFKSLMHRKLVLGKIIFIAPEIEIKYQKEKFHLPEIAMPDLDIDIEIENGSLYFPPLDIFEDFSIRENTFSNVNLKATIQNNRFKYNFSGESSFCDEITSSGRIDLNNYYHRSDFYYKKFNLCRLTESIGDKTYAVDQQNDFSAHLEGVTSKNFKLLLKGNIPTVYLKEIASSNNDNEAIAEIVIERYDDDFFITIKNLQLNHPSLNLNGEISRRLHKESPDPIWNIDLSGSNIDLTQSRKFVLALFGENEIAQIVCNIVKGGSAKSARYTFNGTLSDFEYISSMQLWVDVNQASILIPDIDLFLDKAMGPISILDGVLSGENLTAYRDTSIGSNGSFLLDLKEDATAFQLDLDLDVDVNKLQEVLLHIVDEPNFINELPHFKDLEGRAKGHLTLGDNLNNIQTTVVVKEMQANGIYDRIPWPFSIQSGSLRVAPELTEWDSVELTIGPHHIFKNSGKVSWENQTLIDIKDVNADIDGESFLHQGSLLIGTQTYTAKNFLSPIVSSVNGTIHLADTRLSGPANLPGQWQYSATLSSDEISLTSPHLPDKASLRSAAGTLSNKELLLTTEGRLLGETFQLSVDYQHQDLTYWQGSTQFSGPINQRMINWLDSKKSLPSYYQFKTPLFAENIKLTTEKNSLNSFKLSGKILVDRDNSGKAVLELDINRLKNQFKNNIYFKNDKEAAQLIYNIWDSPQKKTLITWKGILSSKTLDDFFSRHPFKSGRLNGVFTLLNSTDELGDASYSGYIEANNLQWETNKGVIPFRIDSITLSGNEDNIQISQTKFSFANGDSAFLSGSLETDLKSLDIDLTLTSKELTSGSVDKISSFFKQNKANAPSNTEKSQQKKNHWLQKINGNLTFSLDSYIHATQRGSFHNTEGDNATLAAIGSEEPVLTQNSEILYPWKQIKGEAVFKDKKIGVTFSSAQLCGIDIKGQWISDDGDGESSGQYLINDTKLLNFQDTLPCLGFDQSIIKGDFSLKAKLNGSPDYWKEGTLSLKSPDGVIHKMELLSKIFSVVNFTEFLTFRNLPDIDTQGLQYNDLIIESNVKKHQILIDKAVLKGKGLNLTGQGRLNLEDAISNFTVFVAPFKMLDSVVTSIPLVGRIIGGKKGAILTFPVKVEGPIGNPSVTPLAPSAIGKATLDLITDTLTLPFAIFTPFTEDEPQMPVEEKEKAKETKEIATP